jgi:polysaccharide biosynthesis/export protein
MMKRIAVGLFLLAVGTAALAQAEKLGMGDAIRVTVFQQPDLGTEARITDRGTITVPLLGEVKVAGLSQAEAAGAIAEGFKKGQYLKNPQVQVAITTLRSRQVSVLGMVARPGRYVLEDTSSQLADVIAAAGGIPAGGSETVTVLRDGKEQKVDILGKGFALKAGDTIHVERAPHFYIYGEVTRSGAYPLTPNMTVMQAIAAGGGITPRGSDRRVKVRRPAGAGKYVETDAKLQDMVKAEDVIYVKEALF